jgi:hypothetical protein
MSTEEWALTVAIVALAVSAIYVVVIVALFRRVDWAMPSFAPRDLNPIRDIRRGGLRPGDGLVVDATRGLATHPSDVTSPSVSP